MTKKGGDWEFKPKSFPVPVFDNIRDSYTFLSLG